MPGWQEAVSTVFGICLRCYCLFTKPCLTFCDPVDCNPQASLSMGFARQEYCSELPFPSSGDLPDPDVEHTSSEWQVDCLALSHQGSYANFGKCQLHFPNCPFLYDSRLELTKWSKIDIEWQMLLQSMGIAANILGFPVDCNSWFWSSFGSWGISSCSLFSRAGIAPWGVSNFYRISSTSSVM